jgi:hypothetical protein
MSHHHNHNLKTVVLTAPQGFGKTTHASKLHGWFGTTEIIDDWYPPLPLKEGAIHLTNCDAEFIHSLSDDLPAPFVLIQMSIQA